MPVPARCPHCLTEVSVPTTLHGEIACPACHAKFVVGEGIVLPPDPDAKPAHEDHAEDEPFSMTPHPEEEETFIDMAPMVDVTFLLLSFFMVTAAFALQQAIAVPKPKSEVPSSQARTATDVENDPDFVTVRVDSYNNYLVIGPEGEYPVVSKQDLLAQLRKLRETDPPPSALMVIAHGDSSHDKVVAALDCGTAIGIERVMLTSTEEDEE